MVSSFHFALFEVHLFAFGFLIVWLLSRLLVWPCPNVVCMFGKERKTKDWLQAHKQTDMIITCLWTGNFASAFNIFLDHAKVNVSANNEELLLRAVSLSDTFLVSTLLDYKNYLNISVILYLNEIKTILNEKQSIFE